MRGDIVLSRFNFQGEEREKSLRERGRFEGRERERGRYESE